MVELTASERDLLRRSRRAVLGTTSPSGRARLVPVAFAVDQAAPELIIYSALDEKPKSAIDPHDLARVRDVRDRPSVSLLVDEWHEDWAHLRWLRLDGTAMLLEPESGGAGEHATAVRLLRARYSQYAAQRLEERPILRITVDRAVGWRATP